MTAVVVVWGGEGKQLAADDDVLHAVDDRERAIAVDRRHVARAQPAAAEAGQCDDGGGGRLGLAPVAGEREHLLRVEGYEG